MRRNGLSVWLFVLALAVQAMLPGATGFARSQGAQSDAAIELCWNATAPADVGPDHRSSQVERHRLGCLFCQVSCSGVAPYSAASTAAVSVFRDGSVRLALLREDLALAQPRQARALQARAPPQIS